MKIKGFEFSLEVKDDMIFTKDEFKKLELKLFDIIDKSNKTFSKDFEDLGELFEKDPERDRILSMLLFRGWTFIYGSSPIFNIPGQAEEIRDELSGEDI